VNCRYKNCLSKQHRFGLCNKHRKWVERGYMTEDLVILKKVQEKGIYKYAKCRAQDCENKPRRNWLCTKHAAQHKAGFIDSYGNDSNKVRKKVTKYSPDYGCKVCNKKGRISMGFCMTHYNQYNKGQIDWQGFKLKELGRVGKYGKDAKCIVGNCFKKPRVRGWCENHYKSFTLGVFDEKGKRLVKAKVRNKGVKCSEKECQSEAHCRGLCFLHYTRLRTDYLGPEGWKNKEKQCSEEGCTNKAACRTLCSKHYYHFKRTNKIGIYADKPIAIEPESQTT
jgi:hypothetical protein